MILVPGKNPAGNVLHVVIGPESELYTDLHGAQVVDITNILEQCDRNQPVLLQVTRTLSETRTLVGLMASGVTAAATHLGELIRPAINEQSKQKTATPASATGVCGYCNQRSPLLPIKSVHICEQCAQIELGLRKQRAAQQKDATA